MIPSLLTTQSARLLERILASGAPADRTLERHFREHPQLGSRERAQVGDGLYLGLRHRRLLEHLYPDHPWEERLAMGLASGLPERGDPALSVPVRASLPDWLWQHWSDQYGDDAAPLADALAQPAGVDLRVNRLRHDREAALAHLAKAGVTARPTPWSPDGLRLEERISASAVPWLRDGGLEVQEEGSQLISLLLGPQPGETVVDLCAGSGGKSLHLAALMGGKGRIVAADNDPRRLERLKPRAWRAGAGMIHLLSIRHERDRRLASFVNKADRVLVDAPCSGTGTLRRNPEIKWRLTPAQVESLHQRQCALLAAGAVLVKPGGWLVYATCSLLARENQAVVARFLQESPGFRPVPAAGALTHRGVSPPPGVGDHLTLLPHLAGTDGFFAALLQRRS